MWPVPARLDHGVVHGFYDRMRAVAPAGLGAFERDRRCRAARPFPETACGRLLGSLDGPGVRALGMWAHHWCMRFWDEDTRVAVRLIEEIAGRPGLGWAGDEIRWMLRESRNTQARLSQRFTLPLVAAGSLDRAALVPLLPEIEAIRQWLGCTPPAAGSRHRSLVDAQLRSLLTGERRSPDPFPRALPRDAGYGALAWDRHAELLRRPGVPAVLAHAASLTRVEPSARWLRSGWELIAAAPDAVPALRALLALFTRYAEPALPPDAGRPLVPPVLLDDRAETVLRGLVWLVADRVEEWATPLLADVTVHAATGFAGSPGHPHCPRLANAAVLALSRRAGELPTETLTRLSLTVRNRALVGRIRTALDGLGVSSGQPAGGGRGEPSGRPVGDVPAVRPPSARGGPRPPHATHRGRGRRMTA